MILYVPLFPLLIPIHFMKGVIMADVTPKSPRYNGIPKQVSRKDFIVKPVITLHQSRGEDTILASGGGGFAP